MEALSVESVTQQFSLRHEKTLRGLFVTKVLRRHATKETFKALDDVSLSVASGQTLALVGHNGSGKSTLLKIIGGVLTPTEGVVRRRGRLAALLELGAGFHHDLTGRENVFLNAEVLGIPRDVIKERFDEIVEFSGVEKFIDTPMKFYSSGMFVRLGFSVAVFSDPDILLVDEVLAVGDEQFQRKCLDVVRGFQQDGRTIILVTHNMRQVEEFCDRAVLLDAGRFVADGEPAEVIAEFRRRLAGEEVTAPKPPVEVLSVSVAHNTAGERTTVIVEATFQGSAADFDPRVQLNRDTGGMLLQLRASEAGVTPGIDGEQTIRWELPDLPLATGDYVAHVHAAPTRGRFWHSGPPARFNVGSVASLGPWLMPGRAQVVSNPES